MVMEEQYANVTCATFSRLLFTALARHGVNGELEPATTSIRNQKNARERRGMVTDRLEELRAQVLPDQWCLLTVRPGREQDARDSFRRYGLRCYWPNYFAVSGWSPQRRERRRTDYRSVIPGYLFVPMPPTATFWDIVERNVGVVNAVRTFSGDLVSLRNADIEVIREIEKTMNTPVPGKALHNFKTGERVRFCDDLLNRWPPGVVANSTGDGRLLVECEVMGRVVPFQVFPHQIERA